MWVYPDGPPVVVEVVFSRVSGAGNQASGFVSEQAPVTFWLGGRPAGRAWIPPFHHPNVPCSWAPTAPEDWPFQGNTNSLWGAKDPDRW